MLQYPLTLNFKLIALAPRIRVTDATGRLILYVHQKTFKLKEDVRIFADEAKTNELFRINADRIFDFSAKYHLSESATGRQLGHIKHRGMRSIWSATAMCNSTSSRRSSRSAPRTPFGNSCDSVAPPGRLHGRPQCVAQRSRRS